MGQSVGCSQMLELKTRTPRLMVWPFYALGSQRSRQAQHIHNIPARIAVFPLSLIGIKKVSIESITSDLVIKANTVVTHSTGA